jgi:hypothetical protein
MIEAWKEEVTLDLSKREERKNNQERRRNKRTHPYAAVGARGCRAAARSCTPAVCSRPGEASEQSARGRLRYVLVLVAEI